ncbi:DUF4274 domain-containing protein [Hahella sp. HN01]|uniref:DUF4274 domain-containing protein n=1 Tax=Hahella sp. HN01 TaxID=2847262 RepID=UPI001C1EF50C|nr:DUF4274 domain-containing protein [Hahella sp. HN01]MBU6952143.1 DUF4274 domain-containing protein [Hahella sp. HN01]
MNNDYSPEVNAWLDKIRGSLQSRISSYEQLVPSEKSKYPDTRSYLIWTVEKQKKYGYPGPVARDVDHLWDEARPKVRKEIGGKAEAALVAAEILRDEFGIDIVELVLRHSQPCYGLQDQLDEIDWDTEEELGYKKIAKLIKDKKLDRGSALQIYWEFAPEYYTQYASEKDIEDSHKKKAFKLIKAIEKRLLNNDFATNLISYRPSPENAESENPKWRIPDELKAANL